MNTHWRSCTLLLICLTFISGLSGDSDVHDGTDVHVGHGDHAASLSSSPEDLASTDGALDEGSGFDNLQPTLDTNLDEDDQPTSDSSLDEGLDFDGLQTAPDDTVDEASYDDGLSQTSSDLNLEFNVDDQFADEFGQEASETNEVPIIPDVIPSDDENETELSNLSDPLPGYEVPPCPDIFVNETREVMRDECVTENVQFCQDVAKDECLIQCQVIMVQKSKTVDEEICLNATREECVERPVEVCSNEEVPVTKTIQDKVCSTVPTPKCIKTLQEKECFSIDEEVCLPEEVSEQVQRQVEECNPVNATKCIDEPQRVCVDVDVPIKVLVPVKKCIPVEKKVCHDQEVSKRVCKEIPKQECTKVWSTESKWVVSTECHHSTDCNQKWPSSSTGSKWSSTSQRIWKRSPCNSSPKCWPVKRWVGMPVWKNVCKEVWINECQNIWTTEPKCDWVSELKCKAGERWETTMKKQEECKNVSNPVCTFEERQECKTIVKTATEKRIEQKCQNLTTTKCNDPKEIETCEDIFVEECRDVERQATEIEIQRECKTESERSCIDIPEEKCETITKIITENVPEEKCANVCRPVAVRECESRPERRCRQVPVEVVRQVRVPCDLQETTSIPDVQSTTTATPVDIRTVTTMIKAVTESFEEDSMTTIEAMTPEAVEAETTTPADSIEEDTTTEVSSEEATTPEVDEKHSSKPDVASLDESDYTLDPSKTPEEAEGVPAGALGDVDDFKRSALRKLVDLISL